MSQRLELLLTRAVAAVEHAALYPMRQSTVKRRMAELAEELTEHIETKELAESGSDMEEPANGKHP